MTTIWYLFCMIFGALGVVAAISAIRRKPGLAVALGAVSLATMGLALAGMVGA